MGTPIIKRKLKCTVLIMTYIILLGHLLASGCTATKGEGFAVYLTKDNIPPSQMEALSWVKIADEPVIAIDDINIYNTATHEIALTVAAYQRLIKLDVPTSGKSFVVCVDKAPIYWGAFWVEYSSQSCSGVTIRKPLAASDSNIIKIEKGYPSAAFFEGDDPRDNETVIISLQRAGKTGSITTGASNIQATTAETTLPNPMKGYELYSWPENAEWYYTLITGTNRTKTTAEVKSSGDVTGTEGWIHIRVKGVDEIKNLFNKLPAGTNILWFAGTLEPASSYFFTRPDNDTIVDIKGYAGLNNLNLFVP